MNKNKGIIGIGLILAIVLGIIVVGGGAYYLGKSGPKQEVNNPVNNLPNNENQNLPVVENKPTGISSLVAVISPNGGEVYKDTDKITIKWKGVGKDRAAIYLRFSSGEWCFIKDVPASDMNYNFVPSVHNCGEGRGMITSGEYKVTLILYENSGMAPEPGTAFATSYNDGDDASYNIDSSDNSFTIDFGKKTISTTLPQNVGTHADCGGTSQCWPPVITTSSQSYSCSNIGVVPHTEGNEINEQRVINGKTYCIYSISSGYAGGRGYTYTYVTSNGNGTKIAKLGFTYPSCGVYGGPTDPTVIKCKSNQNTFSNNLDKMVDSLMTN